MNSDEDDDYIYFGTSLPELEEDAVFKKKPERDLTVRDEKGRQRFHGAFTGGFSAGYFNTVDTKEGWEPASFSSSRTDKSSRYKQVPEDFMDDEDFGQFGIAPKMIHTSSKFQVSQVTDELNRKRKYLDSDNIIPGEAPLKDIIQPIKESIGIQMLKKMGWRHGQGIGPKEEVHSKVIGCSHGPLGSDKHIISEIYSIAPKDTNCVSYVPKDDLHGIGYTGLSTHSVLSVSVGDKFSDSFTKSFLAKDHRKLSIRGQAFGVGALEEEDDDIYSKEDMSQYDFSEFAENAKDAKPKPSRNVSDRSMIVSLLEGFCLASKSVPKKKHYPLPDLPSGYKPKNKTRNLSLHPVQSATMQNLNPAVRSVMLGEKLQVKPEVHLPTLPKKRTSRFDQPPPSFSIIEEHPSSPQMFPDITLSMPPLMSTKFKPFAVDDLKQQRYEDFVKHRCDKAYLRSIQPRSLTEWEKQLELDEFTKAASFYQPLAKELDSRFESRSHLAVEISSGLTSMKKSIENLEACEEQEAESKDTYQRKTLEWHPSPLLCKRFNIPNPYPESNILGVPCTTKKKVTLFDCISTDDKEEIIPQNKPVISSWDNSSVTQIVAETIAEPVNAQVPFLSTMVESTKASSKSSHRPSMDFFKEIFEGSSSDESGQEDIQDETPDKASDLSTSQSHLKVNNKKETSSLQSTQISSSQISKQSEKQAFGIFANLDFDSLNVKKPTIHNEKILDSDKKNKDDRVSNLSSNSKDVLESNNNDSNSTSAVEIEFYGPELPPGGTIVPSVLSTESRFLKSSKHKSKHHKHKDKKKKKKKKKHKHLDGEKDEESSSNEEEILSAKIIEKLKQLQNKSARK